MKRQTTKQEDMGAIGEKIVADYWIAKGAPVEMSKDKYDRIKDMTINGITVEVKTQVIYVKENAFTVREDQIPKITQVGVVFWICVPNDERSSPHDGGVFMIKGKSIKPRIVPQSDRTRKMIAVDIKYMERIFELTEDQITALKNCSISEWVKS